MKKLLILVCLFLNGCIAFEPLSTDRKNFTGKQLRLNGYYYHFNNDNKYNVFFLYENGIFRGGNWLNPIKFNVNNLIELDSEVEPIFSNEIKYPTQYHWGIFLVNGNEIEIERWVTSSGGGAYPTQILKGEIKNDNTIHFHTLLESVPLQANRKKKTFSIDETYRFRQFSPKPDSTNKFIK